MTEENTTGAPRPLTNHPKVLKSHFDWPWSSYCNFIAAYMKNE